MLKVAIVDHHLNNYHADTFIGLLRGDLADQEATVVAAYESHPHGEDWCARHGVRRVSSPEEAAQNADALLILAPDDVEAHRTLAAPILPLGKPVFLDKVLASTLTDASEIVALARRYRTPLYSSSALRHAVELGVILGEKGEGDFSEAFARGMGAWNHYGIHTLSLVLGMLGPDIRKVCDTGSESARTVALEYGDGRRAHLDVRVAENQWDVFPWVFGGRVGERYVTAQVTDFGGFYRNQLQTVLDFFKTGRPPAPVEEALIAVAVLQATDRSRSEGGIWRETGL